MIEHNLLVISSDDGDWEGLYVDGILLEENHSLSNRDFLRAIKTYKYFHGVGQKYISASNLDEIGCSFPYFLSEIPEEYLYE